ncbi:MAG: hypothetical protein LBQ83_01895 [Candidatus Margulisbacteria bacterium]|jgi:hypothetical protein|nr:hypothetical protein [Candidatus Margulisiibacteriota bacterium]
MLFFDLTLVIAKIQASNLPNEIKPTICKATQEYYAKLVAAKAIKDVHGTDPTRAIGRRRKRKEVKDDE